MAFNLEHLRILQTMVDGLRSNGLLRLKFDIGHLSCTLRYLFFLGIIKHLLFLFNVLKELLLSTKLGLYPSYFDNVAGHSQGIVNVMFNIRIFVRGFAEIVRFSCDFHSGILLFECG
jgi:hypothetical protein